MEDWGNSDFGVEASLQVLVWGLGSRTLESEASA